jgi:hypothetical protein
MDLNHDHAMWGPPFVSLVINPINYSYLRTIIHSEIGVINAPTERYRTGAHHNQGIKFMK